MLERTLFFSDAVFAIAMTLLVVDLRPPDLSATASDASIASALTASLGQVLAFVITSGSSARSGPPIVGSSG